MTKKITALALVMIILTLFCGCGNTIKGDDGIIKIAREVSSSSDAETREMVIGGRSVVGDEQLIWVISGSEDTMYDYLPIHVKSLGEDKYELIHASGSSLDRGRDIRVELWNDNYSFIVNNPDCHAISIKADGAEEKLIEVTSIPFVYNCRIFNGEYNFLDKDGNILR